MHRNLWLVAAACVCGVSQAEEAVRPSASPAKADTPAAAKASQEVRVQYEHTVKLRIFSAFYANTSQARIKLSVQNRFDPELAKVRAYYLCELSGAGITDSIVFDADDAGHRSSLLAILERFKSEAQKSGELASRMAERKKTLGAELSLAETKLVELQAKPDVAKSDVTSLESQITKLREQISVAEEVAKMKSISGEMGVAKVHMEHPAYPFVATFEPEKQLYIMRAGFSLQISSKDVDYYIDLLKRVPELKQKLLDGEERDARLRTEVKRLFESEKK